jgi:hypothetical protein
MPRKTKTTEEFVLQAKKVHGNDKYDYSKTIYTKSYEKVIITCKRHGDFKLIANNHLQGGKCFKCFKENQTKTTEEFIKESKTIHGDDKYDYSKTIYSGAHEKLIIICKKHGDFVVRASSHLQGNICINCANEDKAKTNKEFIKQAREVHGNNKYDYSKTVYTRSYEKVIITCKRHGDFEIESNSHLQGSICAKCSNEDKGSVLFKKIDEHQEAILYLILLENENEKFVKIGVTTKIISSRMRCDITSKYKYTLLKSRKSNLKEIVKIETKLHKDLIKFKYEPLIKFNGYTECYDLKVLEFL